MNKRIEEDANRVKPVPHVHSVQRPASPIDPKPPGVATRPPVRGNSASYKAMLAEAYDGDASEAQIAIDHDVRPADEKTEFSDVSEEDAVEHKPSRKPAFTIPDEAEQQTTEEVVAPRVDASDRLKDETGRQPSAKSAHDNLMLLSSQMRPVETATHVSFAAFMQLVDILSQPLWQRRTGSLEALLRNQASFQAEKRKVEIKSK